jgi:hypothetical protein
MCDIIARENYLSVTQRWLPDTPSGHFCFVDWFSSLRITVQGMHLDATARFPPLDYYRPFGFVDVMECAIINATACFCLSMACIHRRMLW